MFSILSQFLLGNFSVFCFEALAMLTPVFLDDGIINTPVKGKGKSTNIRIRVSNRGTEVPVVEPTN